ncbi:hypothetical protein [Chryseobacterium indoltheticum]|jgi:hypothetical protein|uniref:hypothetical protein n=1 Tax=Chryseobacterium indoltheticum TaxID=254 RepID=UPI00242A3899|nr:hypothetical protein [Chryseobacterium indoltheticum]MDF2833928.1 hypothetical protein [Chryseobacterium indoltheticum]
MKVLLRIYRKNNIFFLCFSFFLFTNYISSCFGQNIRYGYVDSLKTGDLVVIDMLQNRDGRFFNNDELIKFKKFTESSDGKVKIYINYFLGNSKLNKAYSDALKKSLHKYINNSNIEIISMGDTNPIICDKNNKYFRNNNTRLEIQFK